MRKQPRTQGCLRTRPLTPLVTFQPCGRLFIGGLANRLGCTVVWPPKPVLFVLFFVLFCRYPCPARKPTMLALFFLFFVMLTGQEESVLEEAAVLRRLTHSSVVHLLRFETLPSYHYLVLEVCFACFRKPRFFVCVFLATGALTRVDPCTPLAYVNLV